MAYNNRSNIFAFFIYCFISQFAYSSDIFNCLSDSKSDPDKILCALQSSIKAGDAVQLQELLDEPQVSTILNHPVTLNGAKSPFINALIMDLIRRKQDPAIVSILFNKSLQKHPALDYPALDSKPTESALVPYDPKMLINTIQKDQTVQKPTFMDQLLQNAPLPARTIYQVVKYTTRVAMHVVKNASDLISRIKRGEYVTSHNSNNAVHCAVLLHNVKAVSLCIMNCRKELFTQKNDLGFTPLEFAYIQRQALEASKDLIEKKLQLISKRRIFKYSKLKHKLEKEKNKIIENATIINMLENMRIFRRKQTGSFEAYPSASSCICLSPKVVLDDDLETISEQDDDEELHLSTLFIEDLSPSA